MEKPLLSTPAPATALADQFQVTELEPRLENAWGIAEGPEQPSPTPPGQAV